MYTPELETERLLLRHIEADDLQEIFSCWMQDEEVSRYMYWKNSSDINETKKFIDYELDNICSDN